MNEQNMPQEKNPVSIWVIVGAIVITALVIGGVVYALQSSRLKSSAIFSTTNHLYKTKLINSASKSKPKSTGNAPTTNKIRTINLLFQNCLQ